MTQIIDLRGQPAAPAPDPVLVDPSGARMRMLTRAGRVVAVLFLLWLVGLVLAGLGILPAGEIPLGRTLVNQAPSPSASLAKPPPQTRSPLASAQSPGGRPLRPSTQR